MSAAARSGQHGNPSTEPARAAVVGSAVDFDSAAGLLSEPDAEPDVIVVDASRLSATALPNLSGAASDIGADVPVVILDSSERAADGPHLLQQGARAVLPAGITHDELLAAIRAVTAGLIVLHPSTIAAIPHATVNASRPAEDWTEPLTKREKEVLQMLAAGLGNKEIAAKLNISDHTAKFHVGSILGKLGVSTRAEAVAMGIRRGLVLL